MSDAFHPDDELISAYLDGEATEAEVERVESSPELTARVTRFSEASALASTGVSPLPPSVVDDLVARSIDAGNPPANVTDITLARSRRIPTTLIAVAAGVVVLALAVPAIRAINFGSNSGSSSTAAPAINSEAAAGSSQLSESEKSLSQSSAVPTTAAAGLAADTIAPAADSTTAEMMPADVAADQFPVVRGLPAPDPAVFDPLPAMLPPMSDVAALRDYITTTYSSEPNPDGTAQGQLPLAGIPPGCDLAVAGYLDGPQSALDLSSPLLAIDLALVQVDKFEHLVVLVRDAPDHAVALVVDTPGCANVTPLEITP